MKALLGFIVKAVLRRKFNSGGVGALLRSSVGSNGKTAVIKLREQAVSYPRLCSLLDLSYSHFCLLPLSLVHEGMSSVFCVSLEKQ